ncbi:hypothetical protein KUV85_14180 [Nocardioides panacisoli]|uniref:hypothetical protein n=1 Tax=Nocardioides panacisoli TaxID=627624 RepID=UPI001C633725|nr:hypothetical protein [Nocardioides panacisoli]QYJ03465.1 hypothetical protein KUV85_14180 [Nocardioides panacisoli]
MSRRVLLHVGTPKTGTSYLQDVLFHNPEVLAEAGIRYPAERFDAHFLAALDLMRMPWGGLETEAVGAWDALARAVREHDGTAVVSHEILANADRAQVRRALASLGHGDGTEVHLVVSVRDLVRQIPAEWQENVKHRATLSYAAFLEQVRDPERTGRIGSWFWGVQEVPSILDRWAADLPPEQVHVVTVPPPGADPGLLWQRFVTAFELDGVELDLTTDRSNPSLGVPETALVRRINRAANQHLPPAHYRPLVRELVAHRTLSARTDSPRLGLPPELADWVADLERSWIAEIRERGYRVVGDLDDLVGDAPGEWTDPDCPDEAEVAEAAVDALRAVLVETAAVGEERDRLRGELEETRAALEAAYSRPVQRGKEKVVRTLEGSLPGQQVLRVYRSLKPGDSGA